MLLKCNAESISAAQDFDGNLTLSFRVSRENKYAVKRAMNELRGKKLTLSIDKCKDRRSLQQNNLLWALLEMLGNAQGQDAWDCYLDILEEANVKFEYVECLKEAVPALKKVFRALKEVEERKGGKTVLLKCFVGSSKFNTEEMTQLIERVFDKLAQLGIDAKDNADCAYLWREWTK